MRKILSFLFIGLLFVGCGSDSACCDGDSNDTVKTFQTASGGNIPPVAKMTIKIATPEEVEIAKQNGTLVVIGEAKTLHDFHEEYTLVYYSECHNKEYEAGLIMIDAKAGDDSVKISYILNDKVKDIQAEHTSSTIYYRVVNSGQLWLDYLHPQKDIDKYINTWIYNFVNTSR